MNNLKSNCSNEDSRKNLIKHETLYELPVYSKKRKEPNHMKQTSSLESSLGSISKQFQANGVYNHLTNNLHKRKIKKTSNYTDQKYSFNDTVNSFLIKFKFSK